MTKHVLLFNVIVTGCVWAQTSTLPLPGAGNVTLPLDEYNRLIELAAKPGARLTAPPVQFVIKSAGMKFQVEGQSATGTIEMEGETLAKGVLKVPLLNGMTVLDARQHDHPLPMEQDGASHTAVLEGPGEFSVTLDAGQALAIEPGRAFFNFPAPMSGSVSLTLTIPGDHTNVSMNPGLITARTSAGGKTTIEATLVPGQQTSIWWSTREAPNGEDAPPKEVRFLSDVKTLVSVSESEIALAALVDLTVVQGEPDLFEIALPAGYELTGATGATLESTEARNGVLALKLTSGAPRSHQFLISMSRPAAMDAKADVPFLTLRNTQRETGELLVEGEGAMELTAKESGSLKRMDLKEVSPYLRSLAHNPLDAAFRFHRQESQAPGLALQWVRFPDSSVLAAVAQEATVTTMVTPDGKSLTEVKLMVRNQAQPFLKVALPPGASIVSAEVAGERVKPVQGADGSRVPLLRAGFRPNGTYPISFVYLESGAPFAKKGGSELALPKMGVPIGVVHWEVFLPERYKVTDFGGDAITARLISQNAAAPVARPVSAMEVKDANLSSLLPGQLGGIVLDSIGGAIPHAHVTVTQAGGRTLEADTDQNGRWLVSNVMPGTVHIMAQSPGFRSTTLSGINYDRERPSLYKTDLQVGSTAESIDVKAEVSQVQVESMMALRAGVRDDSDKRKQNGPAPAPASPNVTNLQRRVAGVLPIPIDVPRAGTSFQFVRPLVVDEATTVTFRYRTK